MPSSPPKPKEDRLKETLEILRKLEEFGIVRTEPGFQEIQRRMSAWVATGEPDDFTAEFPRHGRRAECVLPRRADRVATLALKVLRTR
jgi:hypothetical protein